jgi:basic membrane protein A
MILLLAGCAPSNPDCREEDTFCVGLVTAVGMRDDHAQNQAAWAGLLQAKENGTAGYIASIETTDARDYLRNIRIFTHAGYDVIVTVGKAMSKPMEEAATDDPKATFIGVDQIVEDCDQNCSPNLAWVVFPEDQAGYLAGALAALLSQTGHVAAVCASDEDPSILRYGEGFIQGVEDTSPDVAATVLYDNETSISQSFNDPDWSTIQVASLVDQGMDIVFGVGGETGANALLTAAGLGAYGIGAEVDPFYALPAAAGHIYTSVIQDITPAVVELIERARDAQAGVLVFPQGKFPGGIRLAEPHPTSPSIPEDILAQVEHILAKLQSGEIETGTSELNP